MARPLTAQQQRFCEEYVVDLNGSAAYRRAYPKVRDEATARAAAARLLANVSVAARVSELQAERSARTQVTADQVVRELARVAFADRRKLFRWGPAGVELLPSDGLDPADAALVTEVSQTTSESGGSIKIKTADKLQALKLLGEHLGLFVERVEVTQKTTLEVVEEIVDAPPPDRPPPPGPG